MAPGSKKKRGQRTEERSTNRLKNDRCTENAKLSVNDNNEEPTSNNAEVSKQYHKAELKSNWHRFEEPEPDPNADVVRGADYEVLLSYHGGAGSQHKLKEERDWEEQSADIQSPVFDLNLLCNAYKCIPFHKQIHLTEDIFDVAQIHRFEKCAEIALQSFSSFQKQDMNSFSSFQKQDDEEIQPIPDSKSVSEEFHLDFVVKSEPDQTEQSITLGYSAPKLPEKTENLIESLTSCLSLKEKEDKSDMQEAKVEISAVDDLDFLLTLTSPAVTNSTQPKSQKEPNIDEWLDDILDDC